MIEDKYKIILSVSRHHLSFEYWLRDAENVLKPVPGVEWPAPIAFYSSPSGMVIGQEAARAVANNVPGAFDDYFENLQNSGLTYTAGGKQRLFRNIFLDAAEVVFRDFFQKVMLDSEGQLEANRSRMPLSIVCESDIESNEKVFLLNLFRDSGYHRVKVDYYDDYIARYAKNEISRNYECDKVLVSWTDGTDLTFVLVDITSDKPRVSLMLKGMGVDPRKAYVKDIIWERVKGQYGWFVRNNEEGSLDSAASEFLNSDEPLVDDCLILSDGNSYQYSLIRNTIDQIPTDESAVIAHKLDAFLIENGVTNRDNTLLLMRGSTSKNVYFDKAINRGFAKVLKSDASMRNSVLKLIISEVNPVYNGRSVEVVPPPTPKPTNGGLQGDGPTNAPTGTEKGQSDEKPIKSLVKEWREIRAAATAKIKSGHPEAAKKMLADFALKCESVKDNLTFRDAFEELRVLAERESALAEATGREEIKNLNREWREVKAGAKGKMNVGNSEAAIRELEHFADKCRRMTGAETIYEQVISLIREYRSSKNNTAFNKTPPVPPVVRPRATNGRMPSPPRNASSNVEKGLKLLSEGKLAEAKDYYQQVGNLDKSRTLTKIIRQKRSVDLRKSELEPCRKSKDKARIDRIVKELTEFIELCDSVSFNATEYQELVKEFRKIK